MPQTITNSPTASITARINPINRAGAADAAKSIVWSTDSPNLLTLTPSADGLSCVVTAVGPVTDPQNPPAVIVNATDSNGTPFPQASDTVSVTAFAPPVDPGTLPGNLNLTFDAPTP
jgi:hypothetical protein